MPWITGLIGVLAILIGVKFLVLRKRARLGPDSQDIAVREMPGRLVAFFGLLLVLSAVLTIALNDMSLWFIPIVIYLTIWMPQVARRAASPRQAVLVSTLFTVAMVVSVVVRVFILD
ncbi:MAG: hypothetical protein QF357_08785 [Dehalococcoidia bacterium]|nr:hypothetical protein [Dehalococcoidia bacterium]